MALSHLWTNQIAWNSELAPVQSLNSLETQVLQHQLQNKINAPQTSSMGRLFDAASALIGIRQAVNYEGQAAIEMEAILDPQETGYYPTGFDSSTTEINLKPLWEALIEDLQKNTPSPILSARFHNTIAQLSLEVCLAIQSIRNIKTVVLSGGVWQNRYLLKKTHTLLTNNQLTVLTHQRVPANDGGIALGQLMIASKQIQSP